MIIGRQEHEIQSSLIQSKQFPSAEHLGSDTLQYRYIAKKGALTFLIKPNDKDKQLAYKIYIDNGMDNPQEETVLRGLVRSKEGNTIHNFTLRRGYNSI